MEIKIGKGTARSIFYENLESQNPCSTLMINNSTKDIFFLDLSKLQCSECNITQEIQKIN